MRPLWWLHWNVCNYAGRLRDLKGKTVTGRNKQNQIKNVVTPSKHATLEKLFEERIHSVTNDDNEKAAGKFFSNKHIKDGIRNIVRKNEQQETENETCRRMAEANKVWRFISKTRNFLFIVWANPSVWNDFYFIFQSHKNSFSILKNINSLNFKLKIYWNIFSVIEITNKSQ